MQTSILRSAGARLRPHLRRGNGGEGRQGSCRSDAVARYRWLRSWSRWRRAGPRAAPPPQGRAGCIRKAPFLSLATAIGRAVDPSFRAHEFE